MNPRLKAGFLLAMAMVLAACGTTRAAIDYSWYEGIRWPGEPEKPRVAYLWSVSKVSGEEARGKLLDFFAGEEGPGAKDPRKSNFMNRPHGVYLDGHERLYVTDTGAGRFVVIDLKTSESRVVTGGADFELVTPIGIAADTKGRIFVTDAELARVAVFSGDGKFERFFEGEFKRPTGLALDEAAGRIYIADTWAHLVYAYGLDGSRVGVIGQRGEGEGGLNYPTHIAVDKAGDLYVTDTLNFRVQIFSPAGKPLGAFGIPGDSFRDFDKAKGIAVDSEGHIYVVDSAQDMVKIFDRDGRLLLFFGQPGGFYGMLSLPTGIFIDRQDRIYVSDSLNSRVQAYRFLGGQ